MDAFGDGGQMRSGAKARFDSAAAIANGRCEQQLQ